MIIFCACGKCIPFSLHYVLGAAFVPHTDSLYYIPLSLQTYTSAPHTFREILISIPQATYIPFSPKPFPTHFQWYIFIFCGESTPKTATIFPHHPLVVAVRQAIELVFHVLVVGAFIPAPFRSGCRLVPHPQPDTAFHLHFLHPPQHRAALVFLFSLHIFRSFSHTHAIFPPISSGCLLSCGESTPKVLSTFF